MIMIEPALAFITITFLSLQLYHYILYPLVLFVLAQARPKRVVATGATPRVTIVTAAHNEAAVIAEKLENTLALDYPDLQIIAVSDGSTDGTAEIMRSFADRGVTVVVLPERRGKANALNIAADLASGEIFVVSDANARNEPDALKQLVRSFADTKVGLVSGYVSVCKDAADGSAVAPSEGFYWRYESFIRRMETRIGSTVGVVGAILAIRRELFPSLPTGIINDDLFLAMHVLRSGRRVVFEPGAACWRRPSRTMDDEARRRTRVTAGRFQQLLDLRAWPWSQPQAVFSLFSHKLLRLALPFLMIGALIANAALLAFPPLETIFALTLTAQCGIYALALLGWANERAGRRWKLAALAYYVVRGNLSTIGGLVGHATGRQSMLWRKVAR